MGTGIPDRRAVESRPSRRGRADTGSSRDRPGTADPAGTNAPTADAIVALQSSIGNAATSRLIQRQPSGATKPAPPDWDPRGPASTRPVVIKDPKVRRWGLTVNGKPQSFGDGRVGVHSGDRATVGAEISLNGSRPRSLHAVGSVLESQALRTDADDQLETAVYGSRTDPGSISGARWVSDNVVEWDLVFGGHAREGARIDVSINLADGAWSDSTKLYFLAVDPDVNAPDIAQKKRLFLEARDRLPDKIRNRATLWLVAAGLALQNAKDPEDPTQKSNFYRALAGNLLWAATSLFAVWNPIVIAMSFVGAAAASGVGAEHSLPSGKDALAGLLTQAHDKLVEQKILDEITLQVATRFTQELISEPATQERVLWETLFPGITFESSDEIRKNVEAELNRRLVSFREQYEAWMKWTFEEGYELAQQAGIDSETATGALQDVERWADSVRRKHPFQATFDAMGLSQPPKGTKNAPRR